MKKNDQHSNIPLDLQDRDLSLFRGLFKSRVMTTAHIAAPYFDGKKEAAKKRLQKIKAAGLISERKPRVNEKSILFLSRKGFTLLQREESQRWRNQPPTRQRTNHIERWLRGNFRHSRPRHRGGRKDD